MKNLFRGCALFLKLDFVNFIYYTFLYRIAHSRLYPDKVKT
jgi:hypothetical protein